MKNIICPICSLPLEEKEKTFLCEKGHSFDKAKEGYVNLLASSHKNGSLIGDNREMALSRRAFLEKGYFDTLADAVISFIKEKNIPCPVITDICCGEGYYSHRVKEALDCKINGFDLSKEMVRLAAKRRNGNTYFVANLARIPIESESTDIAFHLFAPFHEKEFRRIIKKDGCILSVAAGENHLYELKEVLYDTPYKNDEKPPETKDLKLLEKRKFTKEIDLSSKEDIQALFQMTPYYYRTKKEDKAKLDGFESLKVTTEFVMFVYGK